MSSFEDEARRLYGEGKKELEHIVHESEEVLKSAAVAHAAMTALVSALGVYVLMNVCPGWNLGSPLAYMLIVFVACWMVCYYKMKKMFRK